MEKLRIAFDAKRLFCNQTGLGNYSRQLVSGLVERFPQAEALLFTPKMVHNGDTAAFFRAPYRTILPQGVVGGGFWRSWAVKHDLKHARPRIFHGLSNELPFTMAHTKIPSVVTIHDLIYKHVPEDFPAVDRLAYQFKFKSACSLATRIIAVSQATKDDIVAHFRIDPAKVSVVYQSCHERYRQGIDISRLPAVLAKYNLPPRFFLYVGSIIERKDLLSAVKAMHALGDAVQIPLVAVGGGREYRERVLEYVASKRLGRQVLFPSRVSSEDLPYLYHAAALLVYPSKIEGFGIPIIEALSMGRPVVTTTGPALCEAGGPGALYVQPGNHLQIAESILRLQSDESLYNSLVCQGQEYVKRFAPLSLAEDLMAVYKMCL